MSAAVDYTHDYDPDADFDAVITLGTGRRIADWLRTGDEILELGCATGLMTTLLARGDTSVVGVDRSGPYLARARMRGLRGATFLDGDVETLSDIGAFDHVVATNLLHELRDPQAFLTSCAARLTPGGLIHISLQNPRSLHRLVALEMGLIGRLDELSARGVRYGSNRLFEAEEIEAIARAAGLETVRRDGVLLKPLTNAQMASLPAEVVAGLDLAARHLPGHAAVNLFTFRSAHA